MNVIKVTLGFLELAFALKFLSVADLAYGWRLLDRETFLALWIVIFALLGFYLLGKIKFPHDDDDNKVGASDEAKVEQRGAHRPVVVDLVSSTEVEGHTKATQAGTIDIHVVHATVGALSINLVLFLLLFISEALHRHIGHRLSRHGPFVRTAEVGT